MGICGKLVKCSIINFSMSNINKGQGIDGERDPLDFSLELQAEAKLIQALKLGDFEKDEKLRADFLEWDAKEREPVTAVSSPFVNLQRMLKKVKLLIMAGVSYKGYVSEDLKDIFILADNLVSKASTFSSAEKAMFNSFMDEVDAISAALNPNPDQQ
jgi:hypothetical protein